MSRPIIMPGFDFAGQEKRRLERLALRQNRIITPRSKSRKQEEQAAKSVAARAEQEKREKESEQGRNELLKKLKIERARMKEGFLVDPTRLHIISSIRGDPEQVFGHLLAGDSTDWEAATRAAISIRNPQYSLKHFYDDCKQAFPELKLYMAYVSDRDDYLPDVSSGMTASCEYRRTVGALFAVYWLARIGIDGERGFSFGVDEDWRPRSEPADTNESGVLDTAKQSSNHTERNRGKRLAFHDEMDWAKLRSLYVDARLLALEDGQYVVNAERMTAMLALTAFHDIMKVEALLPRVSEAAAGFQGYAEGNMINDHDTALAYVLDFHPGLLPSFGELSREEQLSVAFTQAKMNFNHGWLVQAEAPPDSLFTKFKSVIDTEGVDKGDIAYYFVHWLTDLAGAHPSPLEGSVKFVLQFPQPVLASFINSFSVLNELATKSETQVFEEYLVQLWNETAARGVAIGPQPTGNDAVALMRLMIQAQQPQLQEQVVAGFAKCAAADREVLAAEMGQTGMPGQTYSSGPSEGFGPAFLVYYSPAFLRRALSTGAVDTLRLLAEVYRRGRAMFPRRMDFETGQTVSIRVDQLKEKATDEIMSVYGSGDVWVLNKRNELEAVVERRPKTILTDGSEEGTFLELKFDQGE